MSRLIDADKIWFRPDERFGSIVAKFSIDATPTIDAEPIRHGHWIRKGGSVYCGRCEKGYRDRAGVVTAEKHNYCPNCGAKMDGKEDTE